MSAPPPRLRAGLAERGIGLEEELGRGGTSIVYRATDRKHARPVTISLNCALGVKRIRQVMERIESIPELYAIVWRDVRAARLRQFRHVLYYVVHDDRIEVIAILHGHGARNRLSVFLSRPPGVSSDYPRQNRPSEQTLRHRRRISAKMMPYGDEISRTL